jgi:hypothetical protein
MESPRCQLTSARGGLQRPAAIGITLMSIDVASMPIDIASWSIDIDPMSIAAGLCKFA